MTTNLTDPADKPDRVYQYLVLDMMRPALDEWLLSRGWQAVRAPFLDGDEPDALPVVLLTPTDEAMKRALGL